MAKRKKEPEIRLPKIKQLPPGRGTHVYTWAGIEHQLHVILMRNVYQNTLQSKTAFWKLRSGHRGSLR